MLERSVDEMQILEPSAGYGWYMQIVEGQKRKLKVEDSYSNCRFFICYRKILHGPVRLLETMTDMILIHLGLDTPI